MHAFGGDPDVHTAIELERSAVSGPPTISDDVQIETLRSLAACKTALRLPVTGTSMLPRLRAPMVLGIGPPDRNSRIGTVLVFRFRKRLVAHRLIRIREAVYEMAGDAQPWDVERISRKDIIAKVEAVYADASADAQRVDGSGDALFNFLNARLHPLRRSRWFRRCAAVWSNINPRARKRPFPRLLSAIGAFCAGQADPALQALTGADLDSLVALALRHRCAGMLPSLLGCNTLGRSGAGKALRRLRESLRLTGARAFLLRRQIAQAVVALRDAGVDFALLKGAARIYAADPDAQHHPCSDIDIFVRRSQLDAAQRALNKAGYVGSSLSKARGEYYARHHHGAPLYPAAGGAPIELHSDLSPSGMLSQALDWDWAAPHLRWSTGPAGEALRLSAFASALHLAVHGSQLKPLRDIALLALALRDGDAAMVAQLKAYAACEKVNGARLRGALLLAARLARIPWPADWRASCYLSWAAKREDLPAYLRSRAQLVELIFGPTTWELFGALPVGLSCGARVLIGARIFTAKLIGGVLAVAYAAAMAQEKKTAPAVLPLRPDVT
ncbi:MAG: nucleotidyltransferase family protein [Candidatus Eremiobacteraeota bacterium]|nr:nucleotidyltransferase family protein [Candidatus Eremiobacteraeota bacterium]MBC5828124.1 nucleotidyltransferase family protein [Candidatus Eremiobacteraeota bacterium]